MEEEGGTTSEEVHSGPSSRSRPEVVPAAGSKDSARATDDATSSSAVATRIVGRRGVVALDHSGEVQ